MTATFASLAEFRARLAAAPGPDHAATEGAQARNGQLTKPPGALGRLEDFEIYARIGASDRGRHLVADNTDRAALWLDFTQMVATWLLRGHAVWTVEARTDGAVLGFVLIGFEPGDHEPELGYLFRETAEGRGYAQEAATAARDHALTTLALPGLVSTIDPDNARSIRLATRLGAARDPAAEAAHGNTIRVYRHPTPEA